ncbi:MAG: hypothetical protein KJ042_11885 [Deltaproteobacteria bacterium]|nr:hypothetical protein [Deltaproteobacteria bacterium]
MKFWNCVFAIAIIWAAGCATDTDSTDNVYVHGLDKPQAAGDDDETESLAADAAPRACEPTAPEAWPEPDLSGPSVVSWDGDLFITVNDQKFFPMGFYRAPEDDEGMASYRAEGFNIGLNRPGCCSGDSLAEQIDTLERAAAAGLMMIFDPWSSRGDVLTRPEEDLAAELEARNDQGALFGWYTFDEPGLDGTDKELTGRMHEVLSTWDPDHPDMLVDAPMNDFALYVDDCAIFMVDPYPSDWAPLVYVKVVMEEAKVATAGTKPIIGVMQAFSWDRYHDIEDTEYHPNGHEMRNMAWQFIVHGASGLIPWNYTGDYTIHAQPEIWASFLETVGEINELTRLVLSPNMNVNLDVETAMPTLFDYVVKQDADSSWVFTVSTNDRISTISLDLSPLGDPACVVDYTTGEVFAPDEDGRVTIPYGPLQVRIIQITG